MISLTEDDTLRILFLYVEGGTLLSTYRRPFQTFVYRFTPRMSHQRLDRVQSPLSALSVSMMGRPSRARTSSISRRSGCSPRGDQPNDRYGSFSTCHTAIGASAKWRTAVSTVNKTRSPKSSRFPGRPGRQMKLRPARRLLADCEYDFEACPFRFLDLPVQRSEIERRRALSVQVRFRG